MALLRFADTRNGRDFAWRDAVAFVRAVPAMAWWRDPRVSWRSFAGLSAIDPRQLPPLRYFTASDGGQIAYRRYGTNGTAELVLIHGSACFGDQLHRLAAHLATTDQIRVHTLDLRGHGASSAATDDPDRFVRDIGEFVGALRADASDQPILLGGHSAGGGLVLNSLASPYVKGVSGALLIAPFLGIASKTVRPFFGGWLQRVRLLRLGAVILANLCGNTRLNHLPVAEFNTEACLHDPRFAREWAFASVFGFGPGPAQASHSVLSQVPKLLISGTSDECFRSEFFAEEIERLAPGTETVILRGLGHWDVLTDQAALDACSRWLQMQVPAVEKQGTSRGQIRHARTG